MRPARSSPTSGSATRRHIAAEFAGGTRGRASTHEPHRGQGRRCADRCQHPAERPAPLRPGDRRAPSRMAARSSHDARPAHRHRCRHLGHQVGRLRPRRASRSPIAALPNSYATGCRRRRRAGHGAHLGATPSPTLRQLADKVAGPRRPHRRARGDRPGRRHLADRQATASRSRRPGSGSMRAPPRIVEEMRASGVRRPLTSTPAPASTPASRASQLAWMKRHTPEVLARAATALHCKDWLYFKPDRRARHRSVRRHLHLRRFPHPRLCAGDPRLAGHRRAPAPAAATSSTARARRTACRRPAAKATGLPAGTPVVLGYVDVVCTALGAGLFEPGREVGCSIIGSTGMHMRLAPNADDVPLNAGAAPATP